MGASAGAATMLALCFANGLQGGASQAFAQTIDAIKHTFHVNDAAIGAVPFGVSIAGNVGAVPVAHFCARHKRTVVLATMFVLWGVFIALTGVAPVFSVFGIGAAGFILFAIFRVASSAMEATDPAALTLIADWWPYEQRASRISVFNACAGIGTFAGLAGAGLLVDRAGWRWAFIVWLPLAFIGAMLIRSQREPKRGAQDAAYGSRLEDLAGEERETVVDIVEHELPIEEVMPTNMSVVREIARLRSWRVAAIGIAVSGIMGNAIMVWGLTYFKRTFNLSGTRVATLAPVIGIGAFAGLAYGGFLADRLLRRGVLRARLYVTVAGYVGSGFFYILAFASTQLVLAAALLGVASALQTAPIGPQSAFMMDVTPSHLRSQAAAALNVLQASGAFGPLLAGGLSTLYGENIRLALLTLAPFSILAGLIVFSARRTFVEDVALVVAEAKVGA